jgi:hypothetical protein
VPPSKSLVYSQSWTTIKTVNSGHLYCPPCWHPQGPAPPHPRPRQSLIDFRSYRFAYSGHFISRKSHSLWFLYDWLLSLFLGGTRVWTQGFALYRLNIPWAFFFFFVFLVIFHRTSCFCPESASDLHPLTSCISRMTGTCYHTQFIDWDGVSLTLCQSWLQTVFLLIFISWWRCHLVLQMWATMPSYFSVFQHWLVLFSAFIFTVSFHLLIVLYFVLICSMLWDSKILYSWFKNLSICMI